MILHDFEKSGSYYIFRKQEHQMDLKSFKYNLAIYIQYMNGNDVYIYIYGINLKNRLEQNIEKKFESEWKFCTSYSVK